MKNKLGYSKKIIIKLSFFSIFLLAFNSFAITNDEPCNAISLNVNQSCSSSSFTTVGATTSIGIQDPACAGSTYKDVWFKAIVPANGIIQVETQAAGMSDSGMALYTGTCNSLVVRTCDDDGGSGFMSLTWCNNLTPGETVWIRVWRYTGTGTFGICATQQASINCYGNAAAGQDCIGSTPICNINGYCGNTSALYSASSSWPELDNVFTCGGLNNDSFISFVADSTSFVFNVIQTSSLNGDGIQFMVFSAPSCGSASITSYTCEGQISPSLTPTTVTANGLTPGQTYYIVIDGYAGDVCDYTISLPLTGGGVSLPVKINPPTSNICLGQTVQLIAENGNGNYDWISSPDVTSLNVTNNDTVVANPLTVGTFTYVVNSNSGNSSCPNADTDTAIVNVMVGPVTTDGITDTICATGSSTVQGATSNGNPLWTIQAGAGTLTNVNSINPTYNSVTADEGNTVILTMTLVGCGGTSISHDTIRVLPKLFTRVNGNMFYCPSAGSTHLTIPDSLILDSAVWKNNGTVIANAFNTNLSAGSYDIRFWSLNSLCSRDTTITIVSQQDLVLENDQFICQNTYTFSGNIGGGGTGSWAYLNNPNPVPTFSNNTLNATVNFPFTGTYTLEYSESTCLDKDTIVITWEDAPVYGLPDNIIACPGQPANLIVRDSLNINSISWGLPTLALDTLYSANLTAGTYTINATSIHNCPGDTTIIVTTITPVKIVYSGAVDCNDSTVFLDQNIGNPNGQWICTNNQTVSFTPSNNITTTIVVPEFGDYTFVYTESTCNDDDTITIKFRPDSYVDLIDYKICSGFNKEILTNIFLPQFVTSIEWTVNDNPAILGTNETYSTSDAGIYYCTVAGLCTSYTDSSILTVKTCDLNIPNTFSPNGDGNNDFFKLLTEDLDFFKTFNISIVNRWGNIVAEFSIPDFKWDGKDKNGNLVENGVYFYNINSTTIEETELKKQGFIQVFTDK